MTAFQDPRLPAEQLAVETLAGRRQRRRRPWFEAPHEPGDRHRLVRGRAHRDPRRPDELRNTGIEADEYDAMTLFGGIPHGAVIDTCDDSRLADFLAPEVMAGRPDLSGATVQVLYVHNTTDQPRSFRPAAVFGGDVTLLPLSGEITTAREEGTGPIAQPAPQGDVRLGRTDATGTA